MSTNQSAPSTQTGPSPSSQWRSQTFVGSLISSPPSRVDEIFVSGNEPRIVGGEEQGQSGDVVGDQAAVEALGVDDLRLALRRVPAQVPRGADIAGDDAGHSDIIWPELAGERAGEALDRRLGGLVERHV